MHTYAQRTALDAIGQHARATELHERRLEIATELNDLSAQGMR